METRADYGLGHPDGADMMLLGVDAVVFGVEPVWRNHGTAGTDETWPAAMPFKRMLFRRPARTRRRLMVRRSCSITAACPSSVAKSSGKNGGEKTNRLKS